MFINITSVCYGHNCVNGDIGCNYLVVDIYKDLMQFKGYLWNGISYDTCETYLYNSMEG